jgi:hypothetical protein
MHIGRALRGRSDNLHSAAGGIRASLKGPLCNEPSNGLQSGVFLLFRQINTGAVSQSFSAMDAGKGLAWEEHFCRINRGGQFAKTGDSSSALRTFLFSALQCTLPRIDMPEKEQQSGL